MSQPALPGRPVPDRRWLGAESGRLAGNRCTEIPHGLKRQWWRKFTPPDFRPGYACALCVRKGLCLFRQHPDWLLKVDGKPWCCGCNWSSFYALDIDNRVLDYLRRVFDRVLNDWGFDLVKLDFLYGAAPFGNARESRAARMYRAMELLRTWCGQKQILGCGVPVMPASGCGSLPCQL